MLSASVVIGTFRVKQKQRCPHGLTEDINNTWTHILLYVLSCAGSNVTCYCLNSACPPSPPHPPPPHTHTHTTTTYGERGYIEFGVDPACWHWCWCDTVSVLPAQYLEPVVGFLSNFHIYNWDITKNRFDFGDLDLIFKVTAVEKLKIHGGGTFVFSENTVTNSYFSTKRCGYSSEVPHWGASDEYPRCIFSKRNKKKYQ